jgi:hypothetical protein
MNNQRIDTIRGVPMTLCPVAIAVGCKKCPVFKVCPAKSTLGDHKPSGEPPASESKTDAERK